MTPDFSLRTVGWGRFKILISVSMPIRVHAFANVLIGAQAIGRVGEHGKDLGEQTVSQRNDSKQKGLSVRKQEVVKQELFRQRSAVGKKYRSQYFLRLQHGQVGEYTVEQSAEEQPGNKLLSSIFGIMQSKFGQ